MARPTHARPTETCDEAKQSKGLEIDFSRGRRRSRSSIAPRKPFDSSAHHQCGAANSNDLTGAASIVMWVVWIWDGMERCPSPRAGRHLQGDADRCGGRRWLSRGWDHPRGAWSVIVDWSSCRLTQSGTRVEVDSTQSSTMRWIHCGAALSERSKASLARDLRSIVSATCRGECGV